jgi:hypothetical protein
LPQGGKSVGVERHLQCRSEHGTIYNCVWAGKVFEFMRMEKVAVNVPNYKFGDVPSGNAIAAQRQPQHAAEQGVLNFRISIIGLFQRK